MNTTTHKSFILKVSTTPHAGIGVFALHDIAKGTYLELFQPDSEEEICDKETVPIELQTYCIAQENDKLLCPKFFNRLDIANYLNHSEVPNITRAEDARYFADREIKAGEELFLNYRVLGEPENEWKEYYKG